MRFGRDAIELRRPLLSEIEHSLKFHESLGIEPVGGQDDILGPGNSTGFWDAKQRPRDEAPTEPGENAGGDPEPDRHPEDCSSVTPSEPPDDVETIESHARYKRRPFEDVRMSEDTVRCWLVERDFWDEDLVTLIYATPDGERYYQRQLAGDLLASIDVTAARDVPVADLEPTTEADCERYATEARRMMESHDPDDVV